MPLEVCICVFVYLCICICMYDTSKHHFGHPCTKFKRYNMSIGFMPLKVLGRNEIQEGGGGKFLLYHPPQILNSAPGRGVFVFNTPTRSVAGDLPCPAHLGGRDCCHQAPLSAAVNCPGEKQCHINKQPQPWSCFWKGCGYWVVKVATFKEYLWFLITECTSYVPTSHSDFPINHCSHCLRGRQVDLGFASVYLNFDCAYLRGVSALLVKAHWKSNSDLEKDFWKSYNFFGC